MLGLSLSIGEGLLLWVVGLAGVLLLPFQRRTRARAVFLLGFLLFSLLAVCPDLIFRTHYFILMLPAVSLLVGAAVFVVRRRLWSEYPLMASFWVAGMTLLPPTVALLSQRAIYFSKTPDAVCRQIYGTSGPFVESIDIADYIRAHTGPNDRVAVLGSEPQIYFYCQRPPATGHIYMYAMMENQPYAHQFQEQMIREIEAARPKYVVQVKMPFSWLQSPQSDKNIFKWFDRYRTENLKLVGLVKREPTRRTIYRWDKPNLRDDNSELNWVAIYKRISPE
jgi:hypothetical protein